MGLSEYFTELIKKVEASEEITNKGTDSEGFYKPTRTILLRNLQMLKDLHAKPLAKPMLRTAWEQVVKQVPAEWLVLGDEDKAALKEMLKD